MRRWVSTAVVEGATSRGATAQKQRFVDRVRLKATGGRGGDGCVGFINKAQGLKVPSGGHGGRGGDVIVTSFAGVQGLNFSRPHYNAPSGGSGGNAGKKGRCGSNLVLRVPCGTIVRSASRGERGTVLADLDHDGASVLIASGGTPGLGNSIFQGSRRRNAMSPKKLPGNYGQTVEVDLVLKTIADVGLVGYPNAGKSTLLGALSLARPKVAPYPFTTLVPHVGYVEYDDGFRLTVADIPGLVDGAHDDRGLGHEFLRHIERTSVLAFVVDAASSENRDPCKDLELLMNELRLYDPSLIDRRCILLANKMDMVPKASKIMEQLRQATDLEVYQMSAKDPSTGIAEVAMALRRHVEESGDPPAAPSS